MTPDGDFNVVNVGEKVLFTVKKYREDNVRKWAVGCFANEKRIPTDDGGDVSASSDEDNASSNEEDETCRTSYEQNEFKILQVVKDKFAKYALKKHKHNSHKNLEQQMTKSKWAKPNNETRESEVTEEMEVEDEEVIQRAVVAAEIAEMALLQSNISTGLESLIANWPVWSVYKTKTNTYFRGRGICSSAWQFALSTQQQNGSIWFEEQLWIYHIWRFGEWNDRLNDSVKSGA